ncbi:MAG TPA: nuclear transport factor 2 family protein [Kofleriaceae bacterium]|nr:nuclear transport factor 2 family protein [Kofleriaceae bacterium]
MKTVLVLVGCLSLDPVLAQPPKAPSEDSSVADTLIKIAHDWGDAEITGNADYLSQILADDWVEVSTGGKQVTKEPFLAWVRSGKSKRGKAKMTSCEHGPFNVKVLDNVAVLQGSVTETLVAEDGQSKILRAAYMDVFVKQGDKWVVIRSQDTKI